jgi:predicted tellurium resistance membrane protein TerC
LVVLGLLLSVPIMVYGSTLIIKLVERYPFTLYVAAGVLALTAGKMITGDYFIKSYTGAAGLEWGYVALITASVVGAGIWTNRRRQQFEKNALKNQMGGN